MYENIGFRERKKIMMKIKISKIGKALFLKKGFDSVSVAEIAKDAGISVKTLFAYYGSKEEIVFGLENRFKKEAFVAIDNWDTTTTSLADLTKELMHKITRSDDKYLALHDEFERIISQDSSSKVLRHLLLLWHEYEIEIGEYLGKKLKLKKNDPSLYILANNFMLPFRMSVLYRSINKEKLDLSKKAHQEWLEEIFNHLRK